MVTEQLKTIMYVLLLSGIKLVSLDTNSTLVLRYLCSNKQAEFLRNFVLSST